mgnify:CR=1 FL=1
MKKMGAWLLSAAMMLGLVGGTLPVLAADEEVSISVTFSKDGVDESDGLKVVPSGESDGEWSLEEVELLHDEEGNPTMTDYVGRVTKYMYFHIDTSTANGRIIKDASDVTVTFEYYDVGSSDMMFEFNGDPDNLISNTENPAYDRISVPKNKTAELLVTKTSMTNCQFDGKQNAAGDFRLCENPSVFGLCLKKVTVTLGAEDPTADPPPEFAPETETNCILGNSIAGYQAWFRASEDPANGWVHWSPGSMPVSGNMSVEMWPDVSDYLEAGAKLYPTSFDQLGSGDPAQLFTSTDPEIVDTHFKWISEYGIGGFAVQRFYVATSTIETTAKNHLQLIQEKAEKYNKTFYVMYDLSACGKDGEKALRQFKYDFIYNVERKGVASSTAYAHADGKPVVCLWGLAGHSQERYPNAKVAFELVHWFRERGYFVVGGIPDLGWSGNTSDYAKVYAELDMLSPWMVGQSEGTLKSQLERDGNWVKKNSTEEHPYYYQPVLHPGFSWSTLTNGDTPNYRPRQAGQFLWNLARHVAAQKMDSIYFAMFDEYDEGTAFMKAASDSFDIPESSQYFLTLSADGKWLSSDFYLRAAGTVTDMVQKVAKGELAMEDVPTEIPVPYSLGPVYYRNSFESRYASNGTLAPVDVGVYSMLNILDTRGQGNAALNRIKTYHINELDEMLYDNYELSVPSSSVSGEYAVLFDGKVSAAKGKNGESAEASLAIGFSPTRIAVEKGLVLEFNLMPLNENGSHVYMDLMFSDGKLMSDIQEDVIGRELKVGEWNNVKIALDDALVGKTITDIVLGYRQTPSEDGTFAALMDNIIIEVPQESDKPVGDLGDINGDGAVDTTDARLALQYAVEKITLEKDQLAAGDVDGDGVVNTTDARLILQYAVEKIDKFPAEE